jgi:hypothetical protein
VSEDRDNDDVKPGGCALALVVSGLMWVGIFAGAAVLVSRCVR